MRAAIRVRRLAAGTLFPIALAAPAMAAAVGAEPAFAWPDGRRAAVTLGYDDALASHLDAALPALDRHGFKATFYLTLSADTFATRLDDWRRAAANGHELGNHSLFHQCSGALPDRGWVTAARDLDTTSAERMVEQVRVGNTLLAAVDGRTERTYTVPCGDALAAGEDYVVRLAPDFVAIRRGGGPVPAEMRTVDPADVSGIAPAGATGADLIAIVEEARRRGTMATLTFHGIGTEHLPVAVAAHDELLAHLAANRDVFWVDTFVSVMRHVRAEHARLGMASPPPSLPTRTDR